MAELEKVGVPTVTFLDQEFLKDWRHSAPVYGFKDIPRVIMPRAFVGMQAEDIYTLVDAGFETLVKMLTQPMEQEAADENGARLAELITIEGEDRYVAEHVNMNRMFLDQAWGDGFPLWAPTRKRVDAMLSGTRRAPTEVVAVLPPGSGLATVEKIAINAVMAGCRPEHLPVLLAAVEAVSEPPFIMRNIAISTGPHAPLMVVNGPLVKKLGINTGRCALGPGAQSEVNTVLGRAIRLIYMNVAHAYPGIGDMDTLGSPAKYSMCLGENDDANPWEPYHVEKGFDRDTSAVTMSNSYALCEVHDLIGTTPQQITKSICSTACNQGIGSVGYWLKGWRYEHVKEKHLLLVCPSHAAVYKKFGWSKQDIRDYIFKHARIPFWRHMKNKPEVAVRTAHPELWSAPDALIPILETPDCFEIMVAGAMGGARSTYSYGACEPVTRPVEQ